MKIQGPKGYRVKVPITVNEKGSQHGSPVDNIVR